MDDEAKAIIEKLKGKFGVESDTDLASCLKVDKRTVSAWRARGSVPRRFSKLLTGDRVSALFEAPLKWTNYENAAFSLALFRYARAHATTLASDDFREIMGRIAYTGDFWSLVDRATEDLLKLENFSHKDPSTALAVLVHDDLEHSDEMIQQTLRILREARPKILAGGVEVDAFGSPVSED